MHSSENKLVMKCAFVQILCYHDTLLFPFQEDTKEEHLRWLVWLMMAIINEMMQGFEEYSVVVKLKTNDGTLVFRRFSSSLLRQLFWIIHFYMWDHLCEGTFGRPKFCGCLHLVIKCSPFLVLYVLLYGRSEFNWNGIFLAVRMDMRVSVLRGILR